MDDATLSRKARALAGALEPVTGQVYFSPECHAEYEALGYPGSSAEFAGVAMPEMTAYFCSRGSVMGQVPGTMVAAAFGVFEHRRVAAIVDAGWQIADADTICRARDRGATAQLRRILGPSPEGVARARDLLERADAALEPYGKPLYAGLAAQPRFDDPLDDCWRLGDRLREYRGDAHVAAWTTAGFDACQIGLLTEVYWGMPTRSYSRSRMWSDSDYDRAEASLAEAGLLIDGALTADGRACREDIERTTDRQCLPFLEALGDDADELTQILLPWGAAVRDAKGYPASGPHDLAEMTRRS